MLHLLKIRKDSFFRVLDRISCKDRRILYQLSVLSATTIPSLPEVIAQVPVTALLI